MMDVMDLHARLVDQVMCHQNVVNVMKAIITAPMTIFTIMEVVNVSMTIEL